MKDDFVATGNSDPSRTSSSKEFYEYYAAQSESPHALYRSRNIHAIVTAVYGPACRSDSLNILDIGCNAGTQSMVWAEKGHQVFGLDINQPLIALAKKRTEERGLSVQFQVGTAESLPFPDSSMDVCLAPELLEHVPRWEHCINEIVRVLRPGGVLFLTTTNWLCPRQNEYELPLYSWYPPRLKRHYEHLAVTTRPELVNHATYPAIHWFSYFQLRRYLEKMGVSCHDRFDAMAMDDPALPRRLALYAIRGFVPLRWLAHVLTPYTCVVGKKAA